MAETQPAAEASGIGEAPWPVLSQPAEPQPEEPGEGGGGSRGTILRGVALVGLIAIVTAAGIPIGRAPPPPRPTGTTPVAAPPPAAPPPRAPVVHKVTLTWGPLTVRRDGKLPPGPPNAAVAMVGKTLAAVGGTGTGLVLAGPVGGKLAPVARLSRPRASAQ